MRKIVIFSGTTEGRVLSERLARHGCPHIVCVASEYGKEMMRGTASCRIHTGRMDADEMADFLAKEDFGSGDLVIDATHPYAVSVTENIRKAAGRLDCGYMRITRGNSSLSGDHIREYGSIEECAEGLRETSGNILLTTGSKELPYFCRAVSEEVRRRLYVRILPSVESLTCCLAEGIEPDHVIAMHGPFGFELNLALMRQYDIRQLVTKESGREGGFEEKVKAAGEAGAFVHVIRRPAEETGTGVEEAIKEILGSSGDEEGTVPLTITLAGAGMGGPACETLAVREAIEEADVVFGAERLIRGIEKKEKYAMYRASDIISVLEAGRPRKAVILFSGDTGFYSGAKAAAEELGKWNGCAAIRILPGISSVSFLSSVLGESYEDARLLSLHGRNSEREINSLIREIRFNPKVFALLSGAEDLRKTASYLDAAGISCRIFAGSSLSLSDEKVEELTPEDAAMYSCSGPVTAMFINPRPEKRRLVPVKKDSDFVRGSVPMTKECVRHESIIRLGLRESDILYDIGGGTGSVACEAAALHPSLTVFTIEKNPEAAALIRQNSKAAGVENVTIIEGEAPSALNALPKPDCVFIGGSGGKLAGIMDVLKAKGSGIRYVINAVSLETVSEISRILTGYNPSETEALQLSVNGLRRIGDYHMLQAQNPVFIVSFVL